MTRFCTAVVAAALAVSLPAAASSQVSYGVKIGPNFSSFAGDDVPDEMESRNGLVVGVLLNYRLSDLLAIQPELLYSQKGISASVTDVGEQSDLTLMLDYLEIPLLLRLTAPTVAGVHPTLHLGPAVAFELSCRFRVSVDGQSSTEDCDDPEFGESERRTFDPGFGVGGGVDIPVGRGALLLEARYTLGLRSLDAEDDLRNRVLSLTAMFHFRWSGS